MTALRWTRRALLADIALMVALYIALWGASGLGIDIQPVKWPTVFYGGVMIMLAGVLSVVALGLQIFVALRRRGEAK